MKYNTIIIGAGISGITSAIYLKRAGIDVCIIEKSAPGGQLLRTSAVENYPASNPKVEGSTLAINLYEQIQSLEIPLEFDEVISVENNIDKKEIITKNNHYTCQNIIIATGRNYKKLNIENEDKLTGKGISYCAICDGALYKDKNVIVIGAGDSAFKESLYLSNLCNKVTIIARRDEFRASSNHIESVNNKDNIDIITNTEVIRFNGNEKLESVRIKDKDTTEEKEIEVDGCFIYIGQTPETKIFEDLNIQMEDGYIITNENMQTNIENIYACGDVRKKDLYQLVTATYDGCIAANNIISQNEKKA